MLYLYWWKEKNIKLKHEMSSIIWLHKMQISIRKCGLKIKEQVMLSARLFWVGLVLAVNLVLNDECGSQNSFNNFFYFFYFTICLHKRDEHCLGWTNIYILMTITCICVLLKFIWIFKGKGLVCPSLPNSLPLSHLSSLQLSLSISRPLSLPTVPPFISLLICLPLFSCTLLSI